MPVGAEACRRPRAGAVSAASDGLRSANERAARRCGRLRGGLFGARLALAGRLPYEAANLQGVDHGLPHGDRRPAERGQIHALQRPHPHRRRAGGELSLLHHRAQRGRGWPCRRAARDPRRDRGLQADHPDPHDLRRYRGPRARRLEGRRARQPVPRQHPRVRRHRPCAALLRGWRHHPCRGPDRSRGRCRDHRDRAHARRHGLDRAAAGQPRAEAEGRRQGGGGSGPAPARGHGRARSGSARAQRDRLGRRPARLADAAASDLETRPLCLQRRGSLGRQGQLAVGPRGRDGARAGRGDGGDLGADRGRRSPSFPPRRPACSSRRWGSRKRASTG